MPRAALEVEAAKVLTEDNEGKELQQFFQGFVGIQAVEFGCNPGCSDLQPPLFIPELRLESILLTLTDSAAQAMGTASPL